jgi:FixJ family two-component response regulator
LRQRLRSAGFEAVTVESAEDFLALRNSTAVECLIADINLPGISGVALVNELSAAGDQLPAILITGRQDADTLELTRHAGEVPWLHKPFSDAELFEVIDRVTRR